MIYNAVQEFLEWPYRYSTAVFTIYPPQGSSLPRSGEVEPWDANLCFTEFF